MSNPYQSPQFVAEPAIPGGAAGDRDKLRRVAKYQRRVLFALLANILLYGIFLFLRGMGLEGVAGLVALGLLGIALFAMVAVFLLATEVYNVVVAIIFAPVMLIPCISLLALAAVNQRATTFLQARGIKVGFMGVDANTI